MSKQDQMRKRPLLHTLYYGVLSVLAVFLVGLLCISHKAKAEGGLEISLLSSSDIADIGPYSFITNRQPGSDLTESDIAQQHRDNLLGKLQPTNTLHIPTKYRQVWVTFSVRNRADNEKWMLNFGDVMDGRLALVSKIKIYNDATKEEAEYSSTGGGKFFGAAIPLTLKPMTENLIVLMIEGERGMPLTISPKLISEEEYIKSLLSTNPFSALLYGFFGVIVIIYIGLLIQTGKRHYFGFMSYFALLGAVYTLSDTMFQAPSVLTGEFIVSLYVLSTIAALFSCRGFLGITPEDFPLENRLIIGSSALVLLLCVLHLTILNQNDLGFCLLNMSMVLAYGALILTSALIGQKKEIPLKLFCISWTLSLLGAFLMCLISINILPADVIILGAFWFLMPVQAILLMYTHLEVIKTEAENNEKERIRRMHADQAISRLQKTKESADSSRLLRVIERERALLSNLREREVLRTEEMRIAKVAAERANQAKSAFLAVVSHEIRTPMTGILGMVQLLRDTNLSRTQSEYTETIRKSGDTMMALLNDILDFEKIEHGSMRLENVPFDIRQLAQDIVLLMSGYASQKNLYLHANVANDVPRAIYGDPTRLRQILLNLVGNGLKFTKDGGVTIQISLIMTDASNQLLRFSVTDTGIGISEVAQIKLFTPFSQVEESTSRKYGGTGLGLAISSKLIEAMGSKIKVTSAENSGSTFSFSLKLTEYKGDLSELAPRVNEKITYNTKPMRILVAEDNEINQKVLEGLLSRHGHTLLFASSGHEALEMCRKHMPDLVLMDIQMDGLNGIDTTKTLRADLNPKVAAIPVIALTGNVMAEDVEAYFAANMNGFVAKPIEPEKLNEVIHHASLGKFQNSIVRKYETVDTTNLKDLQHNLEIDEFENFELLQKMIPQKKQDQPLLGMKVSLALEENDSENKDRTFKARSDKSKDQELTEIQKFLMENYAQVKKTIEKNHTDKNNTSGTLPEHMNEPSEEIYQEPIIEPIPEVVSQNEEKMNAPEAPYIPTENKHQPISVVTKEPEIIKPPEAPPAPVVKKPEEKPAVFGKSFTPVKTGVVKTQPETTQEKSTEKEPTIQIVDHTMLQSLSDALGQQQFSSLLLGFIDKSDEIILEIEASIARGAIKEIGARAHDLKGMAGNFGMIELSRIAGEAERAAKTGNGSQSIEEAKKLKVIALKTKAALKTWTSVA